MKAPLRTLIALAGLVAFMALVGAGETTRGLERPEGLIGAGASLGLLLIGSWLAGRLMGAASLPRITGFLAFGMLVGPSLLGIVREEQLPYLRLVNDLATALIGLIAGGEIRMDFLLSRLKTVVAVGVGQVIFMFGAVALAALPLTGALGVGEDATRAQLICAVVLIATISTASSPAVAIAMIAELRARSDFPKTSLAIVVFKDLLLVVLFTIVITLTSRALLGESDGSPAKDLAVHLGGSLAAGGVAGAILALYAHRVGAAMGVVIPLACFGIALVSEALHLEPLLVALAAGLLMRNVWPEETEELFETIEELSLPVYCVFFAVAGARVPLAPLVGTVGLTAAALALVRAGAIWAGSWAGAALAGADAHTRRWVWTASVPQAAVTLALAGIVAETFAGEPFAQPIFSVVLAMIAIELVVGPILVKRAFLSAPDGAAADSGEEDKP